MNNCLFCKIVNHDIPSAIIYEDDIMMAFLDISQTTKGHTLLIPKAHFKNVYEIDSEIISHIHKQIPNLAKAITKAFKANGINIVNNNGEISGQNIFHYHVHLIPRYKEKEGFSIIYKNNMDNYSKEDLDDIAAIIKETLINIE